MSQSSLHIYRRKTYFSTKVNAGRSLSSASRDPVLFRFLFQLTVAGVEGSAPLYGLRSPLDSVLLGTLEPTEALRLRFGLELGPGESGVKTEAACLGLNRAGDKGSSLERGLYEIDDWRREFKRKLEFLFELSRPADLGVNGVGEVIVGDSADDASRKGRGPEVVMGVVW